jgi:hypothetical protein
MGAAFDAARRLYSEIPFPPTEGFDLVAKELAQRNPKLRDIDTKTAVDLQFVRVSVRGRCWLYGQSFR